jgi:uncharacterized membrane protein YkvI
MEPTTRAHGNTTPDHGEVVSAGRESPRNKPAWITVILVIAILCVAALPGTITSGVTPILIVVSAVVLVLSVFTKD